MVSVLAFISGVIRGGSSLTEPTESWAATKTGKTNGSEARNPLMGYSFFRAVFTVWDRRRERQDLWRSRRQVGPCGRFGLSRADSNPWRAGSPTTLSSSSTAITGHISVGQKLHANKISQDLHSYLSR